MAHDLEAPVQIGQVVAAKYRVDRILGTGGMGVVVAATHLQLDQLIALKFIRREAITNPEVVSRFEREARAAVRLKSEHVARIIDVGRLDNGSPFIVMEYLEGQDLAGLLEQGPMSVAGACDFIVQACDAIAEAHSVGIIHRDLKPGNLFLASSSHGRQLIKVLDFGISKTLATASDPSMTRTQAVMGSPGYMSPEQMRSAKNVDGRTDIWSLGIILYELVAGRVPFHADTFTALCLKVAFDPHPPLAALPTALPPGFEAVVDRALKKDPASRFASASELAQALVPFASAQSRERAQRLTSAQPVVQPSASHHVMPTAPSTLHDATGQVQTGGPANRRRVRAAILACAGLCCAAAIGIAIGVMRGERAAAGVAREAITSHPPEPAPHATAPPSIPVDAAPDAPASIEAAPPRDAGSTTGTAVPTDGAVAPAGRIDLRKRTVVKDARARDKPNPPEPAVDPFGSPD